MIVRAVGKAETRPFTHSRSLEKPLKGCYDQCRLQACNDGVLCISNHDLCNEPRGQANYRRQKWKERTAILPPKWKPRSLLLQVPDRCVDCVHVPWCTTRRPTRVITRSTTLQLPRNNSSQEPWKRCAVLLLLGGGGGGGVGGCVFTNVERRHSTKTYSSKSTRFHGSRKNNHTGNCQSYLHSLLWYCNCEVYVYIR